MFSKILIANRGEIAVRIIRACRDMGIISVAVYSEADSEALHAQIADEAVCIGPAAAKESYLNISNIIAAAVGAGAEAIHPGYGFLSENPDFARACVENGLVFIGPTEETIRMMGDKATARRMAIEAGVPLAMGSDGIVETLEDAAQWAERIGYPVMLKASSGGGGKGIRIAETPNELKAAFDAASSEAVANFGDGRLYMERYIKDPRHIEVQILGDKHGNAVHLFERECSIQRRHQKLIEEAPSPFIDETVRQKMGECAVNLAKRAGYHGAGTVEFLVDEQKNFFFCEMNTRIQVEHPVTEMVTGIDLVCEQIRVAAGEELGYQQEDIQLNGHAIECRINAEDPSCDFAPRPGKIESMYVAGGPGIRVDCGVYHGYTIPPYYDSMIAKLIAHGKNREQATARLRRAIAEMLFEGIVTSSDYQLGILMSDTFEKFAFNTNSIENGDFFQEN
ncbi:MAG: acetyl-CoA carboxylase biotin carboxylase subunit [Butyricicoccaceae bacterium]